MKTRAGMGEICEFPTCKCPIDAGPEPDWCARGLPHAQETTMPINRTKPDLAGAQAQCSMPTVGAIMRVEVSLPNGQKEWLALIEEMILAEVLRGIERTAPGDS